MEPAGSVVAVILAAGASRRMGTPKALLLVDGTPLLRRHIDVYLAAGLRLRVVLGAFGDDLLPWVPPGVEVRWNHDWARTGPAESAAIALVDAPVVLLTPVDAPPATPSTLAALLAAVGDAVPTWGGRDGHPVRLVPPHPPGRLDHRLAGACRVPVSQPDIDLNLNTPAEWAAWRARASGGSPPRAGG